MSNLRAVCISLVSVIDDASKDDVKEALNFAVNLSHSADISHNRRMVWKQLSRLLRKQLKQY